MIGVGKHQNISGEMAIYVKAGLLDEVPHADNPEVPEGSLHQIVLSIVPH